MTLDHRYETARAAGWQAIFLGTTEPRAARPEKPAARSTPSMPRRARTVDQRLLLVGAVGAHGRSIQVHFLDNWNYSPLTPFAAARTTRRAVVTNRAEHYRQLARDFHLLARNLQPGGGARHY